MRRIQALQLLLTLSLGTACTAAADHTQASPPTRDEAGAVAPDSSGRSTRDSVLPVAAAAATTVPTSATSPGRAAGDTGAAKKVSVAAERPVRHADPAPEIVRALYLNRWATQSHRRMAKLLAAADSTEINAFVIDMKDEFGLNYKTANPTFAKNAGTAGTANITRLLDTLKAHGVFPIARIVVFKDSVTARMHPDWTIRRKDGAIWRDKKGIAWVNPYHHELWDYNIGVAEELAKAGFGEIQFDYIRFPEPYPSLPQQVFPDAGGVGKPDAIAGFLKEAKTRLNALGVGSTADIFGLVTTVAGALEVGQQWEHISPNVDAVLPMVYPSHYVSGSFGIARPNAEPYKIINHSITRASARDAKLGITSPEHIRPWLQAFSLGKPPYGAAEIEAQKKAVYDAGYDGWVLWNPGSIYDVFMPALEKTLVSRKVRR